MGEAELAVLVMALLAGLAIGLVLPWSTLLTSTGHPGRPVARASGHPRAIGHRSEARSGRALAGAFLATLAATVLGLLLVPEVAATVPPLEDLPVSSFVLAFAALLVSVGYALPTWLGVRH